MSEKKLLRVEKKKADRRIAQKLCKYLRRDDFRKLDSYIADKNMIIHPDSVLNKCGMTGLMISCKLGHPDCVKVFLRQGASRNLTCSKGNTALHYAAKFCMKHPYPHNIRDLITIPFMDSAADVDYHDLLKMPNKNGTTPKLLLDALNKLMYDDTMEELDSSDSSSNNSQMNAETSSNWHDRLQQENQEEYYEHFGKYDKWEDEYIDKDYKNAFNETEDQWADRIYAEFSKLNYKKRNESFLSKENPNTRQKEKMEKKTVPPKKELLLKLPKKTPTTAKKMLFLDQMSKLLDAKSTEVITTKSMPFDEKSPSEYIITELLGSNNVPDRKRIKEVIRIWHPDKFSQMFNHRIHPDQKDDIIRIVTRISQALLNFGRQ